MSDFAVWQKFKKGDEAAFIFIYKTYVNDLFQIGIQLSKDRGLVKDCLQDFFIELRDRISGLGDTNNIRLYLIKSFRRRIISYLKKKSRYVSADQLKESFYIELATDEHMINAQLDAHQLNKLNSALSKLKFKDREVIYYYFYENMSYAEIADIMDYDHVSSARRTVYKILKRLKKTMISILVVWLFSSYVYHS